MPGAGAVKVTVVDCPPPIILVKEMLTYIHNRGFEGVLGVNAVDYLKDENVMTS